jgi:iron complex outermembrane receptor protein
MKRILSLSMLLLPFLVHGQNTLRAVIRSSVNNEGLPGATITLNASGNGAAADANGNVVLKDIPGGKQAVTFSSVGHIAQTDTLFFPLADTLPMIIVLQEAGEVIEEVIIEGTRSNRSIENIPTRVEVLTEEIDEASTMDPSKVAHLLTHSTGIQVQQTSATSNTANVRIQGLDGRYTQILKDGFPLYGGFSGSLSIMQIPPLDLRQVEYVKGSASTLYGGGAISGLINLISKDANTEENLIHVNASHIGAFDVNAFTSKRFGKLGYTLLAQRNTHKYFDADGDDYTDMPQLTKYNFNPRLFFYFTEKTKAFAGATFTSETREGGDIHLLKHEYPDSIHFYREVNEINRTTTQAKIEHKIGADLLLTAKNSFSRFDRELALTSSPLSSEYRFAGTQLSTFSELSLAFTHNRNVLIAGLNYYTDKFTEKKLITGFPARDEEHNTLGAFAQYTFDLGKIVSIEAGVRSDYVLEDQLYVLPRLYTLFKWTPKLTTRVGGGMGYRNATIFNQESELLGYKNVLPVNEQSTKAERSYGGSADIGFKTPIGEKFFININQMVFYTRLEAPLMLDDTGSASGIYHFVNSGGQTRSQGIETFFKLGFYDFVLFVGYTYTDVINDSNGKMEELPLTPKHSLKGDLLYALPGKWRIGIDYEYKSSQRLSAGYRSPSYWTFGAVAERTIKNFVIFGNVENFTDVKQTNFESLRSLPFLTPQFTEVWAPLDGIVVNAGLKIRL